MEELKIKVPKVGDISDGYHTFGELYDHRITLFIALCRVLKLFLPILHDVWRSEKHHDGTSYDGWFVMGLYVRPGEQITYHIPIKRWKETDFARTIEKAPEYDGHTSKDVIKRLKRIANLRNTRPHK